MASLEFDDDPNSTSQKHSTIALPPEMRLIIIHHAVQNDAVYITAMRSPKPVSKSEEVNSLGPQWIPRLGSSPRRRPSDRHSYPTTLDALKTTSKSLRADVEAYLCSQNVVSDIGLHDAPIHLALTFPHGVCALMERFPNLLTRARTIQIASELDKDEVVACAKSGAPAAALRPCSREEAAEIGRQHATQLSRLVNFLMGSSQPGPRTRWAVNAPELYTASSMEAAHKRLTTICTKQRRTLSRVALFNEYMMGEVARAQTTLPILTKPLPLEHFVFRGSYPGLREHGPTGTWLWSPTAPSLLVMRQIASGTVWAGTAFGSEGMGVELEVIPNADDTRTVTTLLPRQYTHSRHKMLTPEWAEETIRYAGWGRPNGSPLRANPHHY